MHAVQSAVYLLVIVYPLLFVVMAFFALLTMGLTKLFPYKEKTAGEKR
jgi:hypothetical protein